MLLCAAFLLSSASCNSENDSYVFKTSVYGNPKTLDPQTARYDSSIAVISNVFQGLFAYDKHGNITEGMIEKYYVSDNGLVWTFKLKSNIMWSDSDEFKAECTADDFVFAFERLFKPSTKAQRAGEYYIIKNSEAINSGKIADISKLGVKAFDKYTLEIVLEEPCSDFKALLAQPPAMPCNREFFEVTEGRYGLAADCIASNSNYYVHTWSYDEWSEENNYFILRRNDENAVDTSLPVSINYFIDPVDELKDFKEETLKAYIGQNADEISELKKKYPYSEHRTDVWGLIFNLNGSFSDLNYRLALASSTDFASESEIYTDYGMLIPEAISLGEYSYRELTGELSAYTDINTETNVGVLSSMRLVMPEGTELRGSISDIMQKWQSEQGFYCNIAELESSKYTNALISGDFDIALVKLSGEYNSPYAYLNDFLEDNPKNYSGYSNKKYSHIMNSALSSLDSEAAAEYYKEAEQLLIDSGVFVPLCIETEYVFYSEEINGVSYNPFSGVYGYKE